MAVVVTDGCIRCKYTDCVDVCPVDCFHEGEVMLVVNPEGCIDCGLCEPACPVEAIVPDSYRGIEMWVEINRTMSARWPKIATRRSASPDADRYRGVSGKYPTYYSDRPAVPGDGESCPAPSRRTWGRQTSESARVEAAGGQRGDNGAEGA